MMTNQVQNAPLTERQKAMLNLLCAHAYGPAVALRIRDIGDRLGIASTSAVAYNLRALERAGFIRLSERKTDYIQLVQRGPSPSEQVKALLDLIGEAATDLDRYAGQFARRDPHMRLSLAAIAEALRAGAKEATGAGQ